ncbi:MAG: PspC domain-containing protein [Ardenticatenaceae bacterium]|nr:PspC domain-containing protein [Ardenticatenaceae bacterium]
MNEKRLVRYSDDRMFLGVASGLARYFDIDPAIVRLLFVLMALGGGHGLILYIIMAILMPEADVPVAKAAAFDEEEIVIKEA